MFAESMLETSWAQRMRRSWTTLTSFGVQALIIGCLMLLPLWKTVGLPAARTVSTPISMGRRAPAPLGNVTRLVTSSAFHNVATTARLVAPGHVPTSIPTGADEPAPQLPGGPDGGIYTGFPPGVGDEPRIGFVPGGTAPVLPIPPPTVSRAFRKSSMLEGMLIRKVQPIYPPLARNARIQGPVVVYALISKAGTMENVRAISGHPMLVGAAIDAVSQWRYRPYILNSEPIEVETQITVNFYLGGN